MYLARLYENYLQDEPYDLVHVETGAAALAELRRGTPDAVLLDMVLPDMNGLDILRIISEQGIPTAVVVVTAHGSVDAVVEAMRLGAFDFLIKPFESERLTVTLRNALERQHLNRIVETYRTELRSQGVLRFHRRIPGHAVGIPHYRERRGQQGDRIHHRRKRDRQGDLRPGHPRAEPPGGQALHRHQLRGNSEGPHGKRDLRSRQRRLHRRRLRSGRRRQAGGRRHAVPRRGLRNGPEPASEDPAVRTDRQLPEGGRQQDRGGGRAFRLRHQSRSPE